MHKTNHLFYRMELDGTMLLAGTPSQLYARIVNLFLISWKWTNDRSKTIHWITAYLWIFYHNYCYINQKYHHNQFLDIIHSEYLFNNKQYIDEKWSCFIYWGSYAITRCTSISWRYLLRVMLCMIYILFS